MIRISDILWLSPPEEKDADDYQRFLNDPVIYEGTLRIPRSYSREHALEFFRFASQKKNEFGRDLFYVIRSVEHPVMGGIGLHGFYGPGSHREEVGYWMAAPFRGKGLMSRVLDAFSSHAMSAWGYARLEAPVFAGNKASLRVAEKCGYVKEGILRRAYFKDGRYIDGIQMART